MILSERDIETILGYVQEAVYDQADAARWDEDDGVEAANELCEDIRSVLTQEILPSRP